MACCSKRPARRLPKWPLIPGTSAHEVGVLAVLHTWGQNLLHHPHLHCVVSGGGLSPDGARWIASRSNYFLPVRVLSRVFRNKYCELLRQAYERGALEFYGGLAPLAEPSAFRRWLAAAAVREWVVFAKPPFHEPLCVLKYLARYTHRVAISNRRLLKYQAGRSRSNIRTTPTAAAPGR